MSDVTTSAPAAISAQKLIEKIVADFWADWGANGKEVIAALRTQKPADYVRILLSLAPKETNVKGDPLEHIGTDELHELLARIRSLRAGDGASPDGGGSRPPRADDPLVN